MILEALAAGNCVLVNDHAPNVETVGDAGLTFSGARGRAVADARSSSGCSTTPTLVARLPRAGPRERARRYSWDAVTDQYEALLMRVCDARRATARCRASSSTAPAPAPRGSSAAPTAA